MICTILADYCILTCNHASKKLQGPLECLKLIFSTSVGEQLGVLKQSLRNGLHDAGLRAGEPALCPPLTVEHRNRRFQLKVVSNGTIKHIQGVLWTDESRCCLDFNDGRRCVWSKKNERSKHGGRETLLNLSFVVCQTWFGQA